MKNIFKSKKGVEVIEVLIIIAVMGVLAVTSVMTISGNLASKTEKVNESLSTQLEEVNYPGGL